jgi:arylsulfatase A
MRRREFLGLMGAGGAGLCMASGHVAWGASAPAPTRKPNIVFFLVDDMGWMDVGCDGSTIYRTPNIDRLASQGMRFTDGYAACPVCSPTRASIMTGKYPARLHLTDYIAGERHHEYSRLRVPDWTKYLPLEELTIAETLKAAGYATGMVGKWHLGDEPYYPERQGFDFNAGGGRWGQPPSYFSPYKIDTLTDGPAGEYLTDRLAQEAEGFITAHKNRPFFLYFAHYAVHTPLQAKQDMVQAGVTRGLAERGQNSAIYAAMIESVDQAVGRVLGRLDALGLADNTIVVFTSDNGGLFSSTSNAPLRAGKGTAYEGGVREPMIIKWPGVVKAGTTCDTPAISIDYYPTLLEMAGVGDLPGHVSDGISLVPLLKRTAVPRRDALYWHFPHYNNAGSTGFGAVRAGDYRLIEFFEDNHLELYNLKQDVGETTNLVERLPDKARQLHKMLQDWRASVGAQMPTLNPDYDPVKDKEVQPKIVRDEDD